MNITLKIRGASLALALLIIMNVRVRASSAVYKVGTRIRLTDEVEAELGIRIPIGTRGWLVGKVNEGRFVASFEGYNGLQVIVFSTLDFELDQSYDPAPPVQTVVQMLAPAEAPPVVQMLAPAEAPTAATKPKAEFLDGYEINPEAETEMASLKKQIDDLQQLIVANCREAGALEDANKLKFDELAKKLKSELDKQLAPLEEARKALRKTKTKLQKELFKKQRYYNQNVTKTKIIQKDNESVDSFASSDGGEDKRKTATPVQKMGLQPAERLRLTMTVMDTLTDPSERALKAALAKKHATTRLLLADIPTPPNDEQVGRKE